MADMMRVYAYVDAAQVRSALVELGADWSEVDLGQLAEHALGAVRGDGPIYLPLVLMRTFVYDAVDDNDARSADVERWLRRNDAQKNVHVRRGMVAGEGRRIRQKAVDVRLAVDALNAASRGVMQYAILITGDADFAPLAEAIRDHGPHVGVCSFASKLSSELAREADSVGYFQESVEYWRSLGLPPVEKVLHAKIG